jgi:Leucine-rich repeat (LRR) protein
MPVEKINYFKFQYLQSLTFTKNSDSEVLRSPRKAFKMILSLVNKRCRKLTTISFRSCLIDFDHFFRDNVGILGRLTDLDLSETHFNDNDADLLAMHATNLKILNLSKTSITETGLAKLFLPALDADDDQQLLPVGFEKCGQVEVLDISGIGISTKFRYLCYD